MRYSLHVNIRQNGFSGNCFCSCGLFNYRVQHVPTEQCLNLAAKNYLCYVSWLRMCQLLTVLTGVILKSLKKLPRT